MLTLVLFFHLNVSIIGFQQETERMLPSRGGNKKQNRGAQQEPWLEIG